MAPGAGVPSGCGVGLFESEGLSATLVGGAVLVSAELGDCLTSSTVSCEAGELSGATIWRSCLGSSFRVTRRLGLEPDFRRASAGVFEGGMASSEWCFVDVLLRCRNLLLDDSKEEGNGDVS